MVLGFGRWAVRQALKDKTKTITIKPGTKFKGQKTVGQVQSDAAKSKLKMAKDALKETFKKTDKSLEKLKKTVKKTKHYYAPKDF